MSLSLRKWATPVTAATFLVTAVTGVVLYFHAGGSLSRDAHIWIGFAMIAALVFHILLNWRPAKSYLRKPVPAGILALGLVATVGTSVNFASSGQPGVTPGMLFGALERAPVGTVAELAGLDPDAYVGALQAAGFEGATIDSTITDLSAGDRARGQQAITLAFAACGASQEH